MSSSKVKDLSKLLMLCDVAAFMGPLPEQVPAAKGLHGRSEQVSPTPSETQQSDNSTENPAVNAKLKSCKVRKSFLEKYTESSSDELKKKFSYTCKVCLKVTSSFGSERKALADMKNHIKMVHVSQNGYVESTKRTASPRTRSIKNSPQKVPVDKSTSFANINSIILDHDYHVDYSGREYPKPVPDGLSFAMDGQSSFLKSQVRPAIMAPPYPQVYEPFAFAPASIVEFNSNCEPTHWIEPAVQPSTSGISKKATKNKYSSKISAPVFNTPRCVLECVENRVPSKPSASSEQSCAIGAENNIEMADNFKDYIKAIALREIKFLNEVGNCRAYRVRSTVCQICGKRFTASSSLKNHYNFHLNNKPHQCSICKRKFTRKYSLKYHMMIHSNEVRFTCNVCNRKFRHPSHYKDHVKKHTGELSFVCKFCPIKFKTRNSLKRHLQFHALQNREKSKKITCGNECEDT